MKKALSLIMVLMLVMLSVPAFAADATTSASEVYVEPTTTTTAPAPVTTAVPAGAATYTVVKGDVFWKIAKDHGLTTAALVKLNPQIKNPNVIEIGQVIIVKAGGEVTTTTPVTPVAEKKYYTGLGMVDNYRTGHTSFNVVAASVVFDQDGKIVSAKLDVTELAPAEFNWLDEKDPELAAKATEMENAIITKGELKEAYGMGAKATTGLEWYQQMANFEKFFVGKTTAELRTWFTKNTDVNGRPIKIGTELKPEDQAKVDALTADEQAVLADVVSGATMSLHDGHGYFIDALEKAYANRVLIETTK